MRKIRHTTQFKKDYKREKKSGKHKDIDNTLRNITDKLAEDKPLPKKCFDHDLSNNWKDHRDCHIKPDLVLIYRKPDEDHLDLVRMGSHSELGL